ncbi:pseudouridine synthase [Spirochaetia bacterium]|nr:pseudouridine synthase [Spirochaetia bacterium]
MPLVLNAATGDDGRRLDRILRKALPDSPLSLIHRLLRKGRILVDGKSAPADLRVHAGQVITVPLEDAGGKEINQKGQSGPVDLLAPLILFENADFLILNKPAGLAVHGPDSLDTLAQAYLAPKIPPSLSFRPGPLHRLDKPTSGVIVFSASLAGARRFSALLQSRRVCKGYLALVEGVIEKEGVWEDELIRDQGRQKTFTRQVSDTDKDLSPEGTKNARTRFKPLMVKPPYTLLQLELDTGRTHQIRAQAAAHGHPLAGDRKYGSRRSGDLLLHAWFLEVPAETPPENRGFPPAAGPRLPRRMEAPLPEKFRMRVKDIFGEHVY